MASMSVFEFVEALKQNRLVNPVQEDELNRELLPRYPDLKRLVEELFQRHWLTAYQIKCLFKGKELTLGQYLLLEPLGESAMGQVFKAKHQHLKRLVTLRVIRQDLLVDAEAVHRFYQEIQAASQMSDPHVLHALDAGPVGTTHFFAMEYVDGMDLEQSVRRSGPLPVSKACDYVCQTALGLQHAFEQGLLHRDLRPANLLVTSTDEPSEVDGARVSEKSEALAESWAQIKICNLGLTIFQTEQGQDGAAGKDAVDGAGPADYLAPEVAEGASAGDIRSDLYSLGCTFYYLLTGQVPFPGGTWSEKLRRHQEEEPVPAESLRPEIPAEVAAILRRLLAKRPQERYQTPAELAAALGHLAAPATTVMTSRLAARAPLAGSGSFVRPLQGRTAVASVGPALAPTGETLVRAGTIPSSPALERPPSPRRPRRSGPNWRVLLWAGAGSALLITALVVWILLLFREEATPVRPQEASQDTGKSARPTGIVVTIEANQPWQDTRVDVKAGERVPYRASGRWRRGPKFPECDADGADTIPRERKVLRNVKAMCLLGRIGTDGPLFSMGVEGALPNWYTGRLFVQANELDLSACSGKVTLDLQGGRRSDEVVPVWQYGFGEYDEEAQRVKNFQPLPNWPNQQSWQAEEGRPNSLGWLSFNATESHAGNDLQHSLVRRWTAPRDATVAITGTIDHPHKEGGDGVEAMIVTSRLGLLGRWTAFQTSAATNVPQVEVKAGDHLDFVVTCRTNPSWDGFSWKPDLRVLKQPAPVPSEDKKNP